MESLKKGEKKEMKTIIFLILSFNLQASVIMPNLCEVEAIVESRDPQKGFEWLKIKVLKVSAKGTAGDKCNFIHQNKLYTALIKEKYRGKYLRVPPLKPGKAILNKKFQAKVLHNGGRQLVWSLINKSFGLPDETSFLTNYSK